MVFSNNYNFLLFRRDRNSSILGLRILKQIFVIHYPFLPCVKRKQSADHVLLSPPLDAQIDSFLLTILINLGLGELLRIRPIWVDRLLLVQSGEKLRANVHARGGVEVLTAVSTDGRKKGRALLLLVGFHLLKNFLFFLSSLSLSLEATLNCPMLIFFLSEALKARKELPFVVANVIAGVFG